MATFVGAAAAGAGCGGGDSSPLVPSAFLIRLSAFRFVPEHLTVAPGATVIVLNEDAPTPHSVTSEAAPGTFAPGTVSGVGFDTEPFGTDQTSFSIPADAPDGTVIPFYCRVHGRTERTPEGLLTVRAGAKP